MGGVRLILAFRGEHVGADTGQDDKDEADDDTPAKQKLVSQNCRARNSAQARSRQAN